MKTPTRHHKLIAFLMIFTLALWYPPGVQGAVTGRAADSSLAGTEKLLSDSSGTDTYILVSTLLGSISTLTSPVITTGLTASGSASNDFSGSTGTFKTSTGVNTFGGSGHTFASGITPVSSDGGALGSASLMWSDLFLASGGVININNGNWVATHTSGILTVGTGDLRVTTAGTNAASAVTVGGTQTLTNKTLTSPVIGTGLTASGSASNNFGGSTGAFVTSSGANTLSGAVAASSTFTQTSASATAFESGPNGGTNPVFRLVNNVSSAATGLSVTGRAAAAGVSLAAISSGTNENVTIDAKGSGTVTINGTATGATIIPAGRVTPSVQTISGDGAITIQSGVVLLTKGSAAAITLAAPSSQDGTVIEITSTTDFAHVVTVTGGLWDGTATTNTTITFPVVAGGAARIIAFGTDWYVLSNQGTTIAP